MTVNRLLLATATVALLASATPAIAQDPGTREPGIYNPTAWTPTILYFHINGFQEFPINTQPPDDSFSQHASYGLATHTVSCFGKGTGQPLVENNFNEFYGFSSPSYVEYNVTSNGQPRIHPERGFSYDVEWNRDNGVMLYWYIETQVTAGDTEPDPQLIPVVVPNVIVRATMRTGQSISINDIAYNTGVILAQGQSEPQLLAPINAVSPTFQNTTIGERYVYKFKVPMEIIEPVIPKETAYNLRIDVYMDFPGCEDPSEKSLMLNSVRIHSSQPFRPHMELEVKNPIRIEYLHPQFIADQLVVHASINSPWGNYDVDESETGIQSKITGPDGVPVLSYGRAALTQRFHEHYYHTQAVDAAYIWDYLADRAPNGLYTVQLSAINDQETAKAEAIVEFDLGSRAVTGCGQTATTSEAEQALGCTSEPPKIAPGGKGAPGIDMFAVVAVVVAIGLAMRRRA